MIYALSEINKGGVGKTTISLHVASALARSKQRVLLIDADPQQSAMKWSTVRSGPADFAVIGMAEATAQRNRLPEHQLRSSSDRWPAAPGRHRCLGSDFLSSRIGEPE